MLEAFIDLFTVTGFFMFLLIVVILAMCLYNDIRNQIKNHHNAKLIQKSRAKAIVRKKADEEVLIAYYELQANDTAENIQPNIKLIEVCNWD